VWAMIKHGENRKERIRFLTNAGFVACEKEKESLAEKVRLLENNQEYSYSIRAPMKCRHDDAEVYYYSKSRRRGGDVHAAQEFLLTVKRTSTLPFQVYLKPSSIKEGMATKLLRSTATTGWDTQADDFVPLELPRELRESNILGLMGLSNCRVYDMFDSAAISLLGQAGNHDIFTIRCRGDLCSIENPLVTHKWNYEKVWAFIRQLARQGF